jgi:hypothetical protein
VVPRRGEAVEWIPYVTLFSAATATAISAALSRRGIPGGRTHTWSRFVAGRHGAAGGACAPRWPRSDRTRPTWAVVAVLRSWLNVVQTTFSCSQPTPHSTTGRSLETRS